MFLGLVWRFVYVYDGYRRYSDVLLYGVFCIIHNPPPKMKGNPHPAQPSRNQLPCHFSTMQYLFTPIIIISCLSLLQMFVLCHNNHVGFKGRMWINWLWRGKGLVYM